MAGDRVIETFGSYSIRHLPHKDLPGCPTFITFRLSGSLPAHVLQRLTKEAELLLRQIGDSPENRVLVHKRLIARADKYLDSSAANCIGPLYLQNAPAANLIIKNLKWGVNHGRYLLHRYCVMPNHVHIIIETLPLTYKFQQYEITWDGAMKRKVEADAVRDRQECLSYFKLDSVMKGLKGVSAREVNVLLERNGILWQQESFDHCIRNPVEYERICSYIIENPVAAGLAKNTGDWPFSG